MTDIEYATIEESKPMHASQNYTIIHYEGLPGVGAKGANAPTRGLGEEEVFTWRQILKGRWVSMGRGRSRLNREQNSREYV